MSNHLPLSDAELAEHLGEPVTERVTLHAWPLSQVDEVTLESGARWIYKLQHPPTLEAEFYQHARSPLMAPCRILRSDENGAELLLPRLLSPTLKGWNGTEADFVSCGQEIIGHIGQIAGDVPVFRDLGSAPAWRAFVEETVSLIAPLWPEQAAAVSQWSEEPNVLRVIDETSQLISGDLKAEHIFVEPDWPKVIDWQRPLRAPAGVELALLLESENIPAEKYVSPQALGVRWLVLTHWALFAKKHYLQDLPFLHQWAKGALDKIPLETV
ncbi:MAG: hypothetical protein QM758_10235 [Armatimonas sp.]